MSEPDGRYTAHGSTASSGGPLPGRPLSEQPTQVVPPVRYEPRSTDETDPGSWAPQTDGRHHDPRDDGWHDDGRDGWATGPTDDDTATQPDYRDAPVVVRRSDNLAGLLLLLAGIAAGVSLLLVWTDGGATGLDLVRGGLDDLADDPQRLADRISWAPAAVVLGGAVLFVLGLLLFVPAKTHRFLGALALLVSLVVGAGVLVPLADADWDLQPWAVGAWFAVAVAGLGFLGALKALMTGPKVGRRR